LLERFEQQNLLIRQLQTRFIRHHVPAAEGFIIAAVSVNGNPNVHIAFVKFFGGLGQCRFHGTEHDVTFHVFFT